MNEKLIIDYSELNTKIKINNDGYSSLNSSHINFYAFALLKFDILGKIPNKLYKKFTNSSPTLCKKDMDAIDKIARELIFEYDDEKNVITSKKIKSHIDEKSMVMIKSDSVDKNLRNISRELFANRVLVPVANRVVKQNRSSYILFPNSEICDIVNNIKNSFHMRSKISLSKQYYLLKDISKIILRYLNGSCSNMSDDDLKKEIKKINISRTTPRINMGSISHFFTAWSHIDRCEILAMIFDGLLIKFVSRDRNITTTIANDFQFWNFTYWFFRNVWVSFDLDGQLILLGNSFFEHFKCEDALVSMEKNSAVMQSYKSISNVQLRKMVLDALDNIHPREISYYMHKEHKIGSMVRDFMNTYKYNEQILECIYSNNECLRAYGKKWMADDVINAYEAYKLANPLVKSKVGYAVHKFNERNNLNLIDFLNSHDEKGL